MPDRPVALASVATPTPERYAKQLASHLGRRLQVVEGEAGTRIVFPDGECLLVSGDDALELRATATGPAELERVTDVVGSHLERFGQRNELQVHWRRPAPEA
jgi:hypothetical protein